MYRVDIPDRTLLKDLFSIITILCFFQMVGLFFMTSTNRYAAKDIKPANVIKIHKIIGYTSIAVILLHPLFIVIPRYFEAGVDPIDAFITMITTFESRGIILGITAWSLMLILGILSFTRKKLPMKYKNWKILHGILSILFIAVASFHAADLGRHTDSIMSAFIIVVTLSGILPLLNNYISKIFKDSKEK